MNNKKPGKNDVAWETLFQRYSILDIIAKQGYFEIEATQINEERESRLMAKFDHSVNLPQIFKDHNLSILPISRSKYIIGCFDAYLNVEYSTDIEPIDIEFPSYIESIDSTNLYSEASAISCAFNTGIIDDLLGEKTFFTLSGRMSSGCFDFKIKNYLNNQSYAISVINSQCEIDAGFESDNYLILIEAKKYQVDNFIIRQLYYPYRLWSEKITKKVVPVLMTYSNDIFSFFIYEFQNESDYNSLRLIEQKNYIIAPEEITQQDVSDIFETITLIPEPSIPFPQANNFERVIDLLSLLVERDLTREEITENYQFDQRQTGYYTNAGQYLGLVEKYKAIGTGDITFRLTQEAKEILSKRQKHKYLSLIRKILEYQVFYTVFQLNLSRGKMPSKEEICEIILSSRAELSRKTPGRRKSTVSNWIYWIFRQIQD
ncbi:type II restriction enzyme [Planktothrix paucivesiculata]|uniref:Translation elongation factor n=1 Tax=Planktothrix paucivesiculata PCC 9631 TaxID=671071 RepID=A0A7Z9DUX3_9CYAN|nr:translation elongation factor [Planktothrix paucivesiculata]VXD11998.1 conserved hypothetical protein [Planktothrix paucivesiculata PCC 9631]